MRGGRRETYRRVVLLRRVYDLVIIADMPNAESMAALALAVVAGGAFKGSKTTALMTGAEGVAAMTKAGAVASSYRPAR
jgi:uncharacterized protein with GYD domain